jgi:hypothetical protein
MPVKTAPDKMIQLLVLGYEFKDFDTKNNLSDLSYKIPVIVKPKDW